MPSFMLIHPTVWPQYTNVTDRQDRTDNGTIALGRTVLQTVAQKQKKFYELDRSMTGSRYPICLQTDFIRILNVALFCHS